jgi:SAM-dependent methyltransferase
VKPGDLPATPDSAVAARALAEAGAASLTGIDSAAPMVEIARRRTDQAAPVAFAVDDATTLQTLPDQAFDGVTGQLGLMDIADLGAALRAVRRVLRPAGWFAAVIGHPCFLAPGTITVPAGQGQARAVHSYFAEGFWRSGNPAGVRGRAGNHHRTIATYLNALIGTGFIIDKIAEPAASPLLLATQPVYGQVPIFLGFLASAGRGTERHGGIGEEAGVDRSS